MAIYANEPFDIPCLGRPLELGMLYDCRNERVIHGVTLWNRRFIDRNADTKERASSEFHVITEETFEKKARSFDIEAEMKLSLLCGMVNVEGSAKYLNHHKASKRHARVTLQYSCKTFFQQLSMEQMAVENIQYRDVFDQGTATHVVSGVQYGVDAVFVLEREVEKHEERSQVEGFLKAIVFKLPIMHGGGDGGGIGVDIGEKEKREMEKFSCKFYGDIFLKSNPCTFDEAVQVYRDLPTLIKSTATKPGQVYGVPKKVYLYPLSKLDSRAAKLVRIISSDVAASTASLLERYLALQMKSNDLIGHRIYQIFPGIKQQIKDFKFMVSSHVSKFQQSMLTTLPQIRAGEQGEIALIQQVTEIKRSPFSIRQLEQFLDSKKTELRCLENYCSILNDIQFASEPGQLEGFTHDFTNKHVLEIHFGSIATRYHPYLKSLSSYLKGSEGREENGSWCSPVALTPKLRTGSEGISHPLASAEATAMRGDTPESNKQDPALGIEPGTGLSGVRCHTHNQEQTSSFDTIDEHWFNDEKIVSTLHKSIKSIRAFAAANKDNPNLKCVANTRSTAIQNSTSPGQMFLHVDGERKPFVIPSAPGVPKLVKQEIREIELEWNRPTVGSEYVTSYVVQYQLAGEPDSTNPIFSRETDSDVTSIILTHLSSNSTHVVRVAAKCVAGIGEFGTWSQPIGTKYVNELAEMAIPQCSLVRAGTNSRPALYQLPVEQTHRDRETNVRKFECGMPPADYVPTKAVLFVGAARSGKTAKINRLVNHLFGICWEDDFRFQLIAESSDTPQIESNKLVPITMYTIFWQTGFQAPFTVTIVDTPEFDVSSGRIHHNLIYNRIKQLFETNSSEAIDKLRAICFVARSSMDRMTECEREIWDSILTSFGRHPNTTVFLILPSRDRSPSPISNQVQKTPSVEFSRSNYKVSYLGADSDQMSWNLTTNTLVDFYKELGSEPPPIRRSKMNLEVDDNRNHRAVVIVEIQYRIENNINQLNILKQLFHVVETHGTERNIRSNFGRKIITVPLVERIATPGKYSLRCLTCNVACQLNCSIPNDGPIFECSVMDGRGRNSCCTVCQHKCPWQTHLSRDYFFEVTMIDEEVTFTSLMNHAIGDENLSENDNIVSGIASTYVKTQQSILKDIDTVLEHLLQLYCTPTSTDRALTPISYIDTLIGNVEKRKRDGWQQRMNHLQNAKDRATFIQELTRNGEQYDPHMDSRRKIIRGFTESHAEGVHHVKMILGISRVRQSRGRLCSSVDYIQYQINNGINELEKMRLQLLVIEHLETEKKSSSSSKNNPIKIRLPKIRRIIYYEPDRYTLVCLQCSVTCLEVCPIPNDGPLYECSVMNEQGRDSKCTVCPAKCAWQLHYSRNSYFKDFFEDDEVTLEDLRKQYHFGDKHLSARENLVGGLATKYVELQLALVNGIESVRKCLSYLDDVCNLRMSRWSHEIATKTKSTTSTVDYMDALIKAEAREKRHGWNMRVMQLNAAKERAAMARLVIGERLTSDLMSIIRERIREECRHSKAALFERIKTILFINNFSDDTPTMLTHGSSFKASFRSLFDSRRLSS